MRVFLRKTVVVYLYHAGLLCGYSNPALFRCNKYGGRFLSGFIFIS